MAEAHLLKITNPHHVCFLYIISAITLLISTIQSQPTTAIISTDPSYYYNLCAPIICNNISYPYPFTLPDPCHPASYQPSCPNNKSFLTTSPLTTDKFRTLSLNYSDPNYATLVIASDNLFTCGAQISRPNYRADGTILMINTSSFTPGTHLNCTAPIPFDSFQGQQNASCLGCKGQDPNNVCYYVPKFVTHPTCETFHTITPVGSLNATTLSDFRTLLQSGYEVHYVKPSVCQQCEVSGGRCGFHPISGSSVCFCPSGVHPMNCSDGITDDPLTWVNGPGRGGSGLSKAAVAGISTSASVILVFTLVVIFARRRKQNIHLNKEVISSISPTRYSKSQLKKFTNNFSSRLGDGGFGSVYKGIIHRKGVEVPVAVKILKKSKQIEKQFMNEVATIGNVHHHNLVVMLGYCADGNTRALVYEFMENGSLDKYIYSTKKEEHSKLSPRQIYNIALETARGILYLHQGCRNKILHCDIKPSNVLLDSKLSAKVADFGLARMIDKDHSHVSLTRAQGTPGYGAPEMWLKNFGPVTAKSDVYSFGMLLLEMVGRRKNYEPEAAHSSQVYFPEWLYNKVERDEFPLIMRRYESSDSFEIVVDEEENRNEEDEKAVGRMCYVGLWCIQHIPSNRPSMDRVVQMLEGHLEIEFPIYPFPHNTTNKDQL
ncbi:hypothetical protein AQUCO_01400372v1 [Aquilegia coerulea]|uniref:Protein kinase domain-containing protein n=1 Tax=Aquilegia coerulea TaxID=218851 RepID=A0A2G5DW64_AQUCA|nr:hypothetical protein AQUCO_01400372v1 [Aquilegia coerulea]